MNIATFAYDAVTFYMGWPLVIYVVSIGIICTIAFRAIQFRYFLESWRLALFPAESGEAESTGDMSPFQAFVNMLSANLGNGSIAGMATALYLGGPGAIFWVGVIGIVLMSVRFAEVYLGAYFGSLATSKSGLGGPMLYLKEAPSGRVLSYLYGISCLFYSFLVGNAVQVNTIRLSIEKTWNVPGIVTAACFTLFIFYVVCGGAKRIASASEKIVPLKIVVFFVSSIIVLAYHYQAVWPAILLICTSAFQATAVTGATIGFTVAQAMRFGMSRSIMATESGLGTAAILFGSTGSKQPVKDAIMSMLSTFISTLVCLMIGVSIVASGVWNSGLTSSALTIAAYQTVFGVVGGWIVTFLSASFGIGVVVAFAYITREAWFFVTGGRWGWAFNIAYCVVAFFGALASVESVWFFGEVANGCMLSLNLFGIICLLPVIIKGLKSYRKEHIK